MNQKVFCIGFHKTGTTSLKLALKTLGYRVTGPNGINDPDIAGNVYELANRLAKKYDAFQDNPWPLIFKEMDARYPGSRFILTLRDSDSWIESQVKHFGFEETPMRRWIYGVGCPQGNETIYVERMKSHNKEVIQYFEDRPKDLLVMNLANGDGWNELCSFLGRQVPQTPFPHANRAGSRNPILARTGQLLRRIGARLTARPW